MDIKAFLILFFLFPTQVHAEKWYELISPTDTIVAELVLESGSLEIVKIESNKIVMVGFMAKISPKQMQQYEAKNIKPITVAIKSAKTTMFGFGGGEAVIPVNGIIELEIKNHTNEKILVDIFKGK